MKRYFLLLCVGLLSSFTLLAQQQTITGRVVDMSTGEPLPGVNILAKGTAIGTVTDVDGNYRLTVSADVATLVFSSIGFETAEENINGRSSINLDLSPDIQSLSEVVVVGYGTQKKENLTGAVSAVTGEKIAERPVLSADQALQGLAPGVTVSQFGGEPGSGATVRIRGLGTLGNNNPLVIIDGVPGSFDLVDPNNIESISILKDAASAAIYGSRAAGGVVLITTKRGKAGKLKVSYNGYVGVQRPIDIPNYLGSEGYLQFYNEALENETGTNQNFVPNNPDNDTDWFEEVLVENPIQQQHVLNLGGGNEFVTSNVALTYQDQQGLIANSSYQRYSLRANNDFQAGERFKFRLDVSAKRSIDNSPAGGSSTVFNQTYRIPPIYSAVNFDGSYGEGWNGQNPVAISQASGENELVSDFSLLNLGVNYKIVEGLSLDFSFSPWIQNDKRKNFRKPYEWATYDENNLQLARSTDIDVASLNETSINRRSLTTKGLLNYDKTVGVHQFNALVGFEQIQENVELNSATMRGFVLPEFPVFNAGDISNVQLTGTAFENSLLSYFGRVNYILKDRYLVELNARYDGTSRFAPDQRWGFFPSVSLGWRISEEEFFNVAPVDDLKIRASWGQLGNQFVRGNALSLAAYYPYLSIFSVDDVLVVNNQGQLGGAIETVSNEGLTWETTEMVNIGADLVMLEGKLEFIGEYFIRNTYDILLEKPISQTVGLDPAPINAGEVRNVGWETTLSYRDQVGDFGYRITALFSDVRNEIVSLDEGTIINGLQIQQEGSELNSLFGLKTEGLLTAADLDEDGRYLGLAAKPGDIKYTDLNGDQVINQDDRTIIGSRIPRYTYSFDIGANYKGFDLSLFFQGVGKWNGYLNGNAAWAFNNTSAKITEWQAENRWDPANPNPNAAYPRLWQNSSSPNQQTSDFWVTDASFLKLRNVVLSYSLPLSLLERASISQAKVYLSGQNVLNFDSVRGFDAEVPLGNGSFYPQVSVYTIGVNATF